MAITLGFIGLGAMGTPMTARLLAAGHPVVAYDTNEAVLAAAAAQGATGAGGAKDVADQAEIIFCSLPNPQISRDVALGPDGIMQGAKARIVVDISTTGPAMAGTIAKGLAERNIAWVDAPVSGGIKGAVNGTLAVIVSCRKETYDEVLPFLQVFGKSFYCGDKAGSAQVAKLGNNMIAAAVILLSAEALAMGVKAGLDPAVMCEIINASTGRNSATQDKFPRAVLPGTFDFGFKTSLSYKDVKMCVDEAEALGVPMVGGGMVRQFLAATQAKYGPNSDFTSMVKIIEDWAGVEIRSKT
ncbi:NAD(P)-dependent oxidoreductase [Bosea thiooxidans]